jgi:hypothetical protein
MLLGFDAVQIAFLILVALVIVFGWVFFYFFKKHVYHKGHVVPRTLDWVFLEIQMPKENSEDKDQQRTKSEEEKKSPHCCGRTIIYDAIGKRTQ